VNERVLLKLLQEYTIIVEYCEPVVHDRHLLWGKNVVQEVIEMLPEEGLNRLAL
jgi:hypothetical protein